MDRIKLASPQNPCLSKEQSTHEQHVKPEFKIRLYKRDEDTCFFYFSLKNTGTQQ